MAKGIKLTTPAGRLKFPELDRKNAQGKWWTYGQIKKNQWDNLQASFKIVNLEEAIALAKAEGKEYLNLSAFENKPNQAPKPVQQEPEFNASDLDDEVPPF